MASNLSIKILINICEIVSASNKVLYDSVASYKQLFKSRIHSLENE